MEKVRIQKIIADSGYCSRRKAEELISANRVQVNGRPCKLGDKADYKDIISIDGENLYVPKKKDFYPWHRFFQWNFPLLKHIL